LAPSFRQIRARYEQQLQAKADEIGQIIEESSESDLQRLNLEFSKFTRLKHLVEETYLKEKLVFKRSLMLCKSLLKHCGVKDVSD
jgi:hypothetical protein